MNGSSAIQVEFESHRENSLVGIKAVIEDDLGLELIKQYLLGGSRPVEHIISEDLWRRVYYQVFLINDAVE